MVNRINPHHRVNRWDYLNAERKGFERRYCRCRGPPGGAFYAYESLLTQEADGGNDPENEQNFTKRGRDHERYRKVRHKAHNNAVYDIWSDQHDICRDMDYTAGSIGFREVHLFLCRLQFTSCFQSRAVLQPHSNSYDHYYDNWQPLSVSSKIQCGYIYDALSINVNGTVSIHGSKTCDTI